MYCTPVTIIYKLSTYTRPTNDRRLRILNTRYYNNMSQGIYLRNDRSEAKEVSESENSTYIDHIWCVWICPVTKRRLF